MGIHDSGYKQLFAFPVMVEDLLRGFVKETWVDERRDETRRDETRRDDCPPSLARRELWRMNEVDHVCLFEGTR